MWREGSSPSRSTTPRWMEWQTRRAQTTVPLGGVRVRVPLSAHCTSRCRTVRDVENSGVSSALDAQGRAAGLCVGSGERGAVMKGTSSSPKTASSRFQVGE